MSVVYALTVTRASLWHVAVGRVVDTRSRAAQCARTPPAVQLCTAYYTTARSRTNKRTISTSVPRFHHMYMYMLGRHSRRAQTGSKGVAPTVGLPIPACVGGTRHLCATSMKSSCLYYALLHNPASIFTNETGSARSTCLASERFVRLPRAEL